MFVYRGERLNEAGYIESVIKENQKEYNHQMKGIEKKFDNIKYLDNSIFKVFELELDSMTSQEKNAFKELLLNKNYAQKRASLLKKMNNLAESYYRYRCIALDSSMINEENINNIIHQIEYCNNNNLILRVGIDSQIVNKKNDLGVEYIYNKEEWELLIKLNKELKRNGYPQLVFCEMVKLNDLQNFDNAWTFDAVARANCIVEVHAQYILDRGFSPFEAMVYIHKKASEMKYIPATKKESLETGRVLPSVFKDDKIICSGYASFVKSIIDRVNMDGLSCKIQGCGFIGENGELIGSHCQNLISINDDKYDIKGVYLEDASFDAIKDESTIGGFGHCLYPIGDIMHLNDVRLYEIESDERVSHLILDLQGAKYHSWTAGCNLAKKCAGHILARKRYNKIPELYFKHKQLSKPISIEKYSNAIENILKPDYSKHEIEIIINQEMIASKENVSRLFNEDASSTFAKPIFNIRCGLQ